MSGSDRSGFEITFTETFKVHLERLPRALNQIIERQIEWLRVDPYAKNPNAKRLRNHRQAFRLRIGKDFRMLYRVDGRLHRVELFEIGHRGSIYDRPVRPPQVTRVEGEAQQRLPQGEYPGRAELGPSDELLPVTQKISVEQLDWLDNAELFLLKVPDALWAPIVAAGSLEGLRKAAVPEGVREQIEDYWTNPNATQLEKLYSLGSYQDTFAISQLPLGSFLVALDPDQKAALAKLKTDGPYLLKGSAGTGKSLVGLYHLRDLILARTGETMFDDEPARYGVITYTNTLVEANLALLNSIVPESARIKLSCTTLDSLSYRLAEAALGFKPSALNPTGMSRWIDEILVEALPPGPAGLVRSLGSFYVADEIEQAIRGNGLRTLDEYLHLERKGRKKPLQLEERRNLWQVHQALQDLLDRRRMQTFAHWRCLALDHLRQTPDFPRFSALFVDEAQDFPKVARQLCLELVRDSKNLVLAADTGQSIYTVPISWRQCDPRFDFRRRRPVLLERGYRATREIGRAIAPLRNDPGDDEDRSVNASPVFSGPRPQWVDVPRDAHPVWVAEALVKLVRDARSPIHPGQIAVIVRDAHRAECYRAALAARDIASAIVRKSEPLNLSGSAVHIVTAHSSKGLGFPVVFVPDVHDATYPSPIDLSRAGDDKQLEQLLEFEQRLLYVALSRASHRLVMVADPAHPSPLLEKLARDDHWI